MTDLLLACPHCRAALDGASDPAQSGVECRVCGEVYPVIDGIRRFLPADRLAHYRPFLRDYTAIRLAEGRAVVDADYVRRLPQPTPGEPLEWQWALRARTWATVRDRVLPTLGPGLSSDGLAGDGLVVLDVGAGVGWLSNRLHQLGHRPHAIDLTVDADDGLGAARHYGPPWPRYQAEMDALPFADATPDHGADVVVFNASLHYSTDYAHTVGEALRVLRPGGSIVVMDSPMYRRDDSGRQMVAERHVDFERRFGTRSDSVASIGYLTDSMIGDLEHRLGMCWKRHRTWYGWSWAMRPWKARLRRRRPPSRFAVLVGTRDVLR